MYVTVLSREHYGFINSWLSYFPHPRVSGSCLSFGNLIFPSTSYSLCYIVGLQQMFIEWMKHQWFYSIPCSVTSERLRFCVHNLTNLFLRYTKEEFDFWSSDLDAGPKLVLHIFRFIDVLSLGIKITLQKMVYVIIICFFHLTLCLFFKWALRFYSSRYYCHCLS